MSTFLPRCWLPHPVYCPQRTVASLPGGADSAGEAAFREQWEEDSRKHQAAVDAAVTAGAPAPLPPVNPLRGFAKSIVHTVMRQCNPETATKGQLRSGVLWLVALLHTAGRYPALTERRDDIVASLVALLASPDESVSAPPLAFIPCFATSDGIPGFCRKRLPKDWASYIARNISYRHDKAFPSRRLCLRRSPIRTALPSHALWCSAIRRCTQVCEYDCSRV